MTLFDVAAVLVALAAAAGYLNHRMLKLPPTSGTLLVAIAGSILGVLADLSVPSLGLRAGISAFVANIDFNEALMRGMLSFLLFAGALNVNVSELLAHKWIIGLLATLSVVLSTVIVGVLTREALSFVGIDVPLVETLLFGAVISPTDPIAVLALLKRVGAPSDLATQIAGESLFNDGVGVVLFLGLLATVGARLDPHAMIAGAGDGLAWFFLREVVGGALFGATVALGVCRALERVDDASLELLMTIAMVMGTYSLSFVLHVSGPIAIVVAGLVIGDLGRGVAMDARTREHVDAFWAMIDELLNIVLFLLLGLQVMTVKASVMEFVAATVAVPIVLFARLTSVGAAVAILSVRTRRVRGFVPILTWGGLRGGLSVAMVLSLPPFPERGLFLACTYAVVVFSILVQGLSMRRLLTRYGLVDRRASG